MRTITAALMGYLAVIVAPSRCAAAEPGASVLEEPPRFGLYYDRYEPAFYTGFAPRADDPQRVHLHLGRGNQLRVTVVLSDAMLREYAEDLLHRYRTYRALIGNGRLVLTQNLGFEEFESTLQGAHVERLVSEQATLADDVVRARNLQLLEQLNPGRVFRIRMPADEVLRRWVARLRPADRLHMDRDRQLELVNLMLPTRLFIAELQPDVAGQLAALVKRCPEGDGDQPSLDDLRPVFLELFARVTHGTYPVREGAIAFSEFTAIYPVGTFNEYTTYHGRQIPEYPTPGRRALTTHQRTQTVDHVPTADFYSYFPWIPYMHVGTRLHNAVHTLFWRMRPVETAFLPAAWRSVSRGSRTGEPYRYLWLLSRGPMSHGCTHLNAGHISELRQILPSNSEELYQVDMFLNTSYLYDVFDIDGDFEPEVMGVRYFIAYALKDNKPDHLRVRDERHAYYDWLYGGELEYDAADRGVFHKITDGRFIGRDAADGAEYERIALREADYETEKIQFYRLIDIPFAKELRKVGAHYPFPGLGTTIVSTR
ncbi:MAG TPA: hypothetical protein VMW56_09225 [Candidatus Margulisiibacteriota bacterium]|nr:hypothetical protein [Candidatus Margulisiibacteriota bacterium]